MPIKLDPNATVAIPCPQCGEKTAVTVGELGLSPRLRCPACGTLMRVDARKILERVKEAEEKSQAERRRRGV